MFSRLRVVPDVDLGPMQDRVHAKVCAVRRRGVEVVPELRRLVAHVPVALGSTGREHALLGARCLLIAPDAGEQPVEAMLRERELQSFGLPCSGTRGGRQRRIDGVDGRAVLDQKIQSPLFRVAVAKVVHLGKFLAGIDVHDRERHAAEERLACEPDHHVRSLCRATRAARACSAARTLRERCRCSALRDRRADP